MQRSRLILGVVGTLALIAACAYFYDRSHLDEAFDSTEWKNGDERVRGTMVHHLVKSKFLVDKEVSEVKVLLGEPDQSSSTWVCYDVNLGYRWPFAWLRHQLVSLSRETPSDRVKFRRGDRFATGRRDRLQTGPHRPTTRSSEVQPR